MDADIQALFRDPVTREPLTFVETGTGYEPTRLLNPASQRSYVVRDGIFVFLAPGELTASNRKFQRFYDWCAPFYDAMIDGYLRLFRLGNDESFRREFLERLGVKPTDRILEVSIGTGRNSRYLPEATQFFGVDISWGMLQRCRRDMTKRGVAHVLCQANGERLPFADECFDQVFHVGGLKFFVDKRQAILEMVRVARPGATLMIVDPTERTMGEVEKAPFARGFFKGIKDAAVPPIDLLPAGMQEIGLTEFLDGRFYCLSFRKPESPATLPLEVTRGSIEAASV